MGKFCDIQTRNELADFLEIPRKKLTHVLYVVKTERQYVSFEVPKKCGGVREIHAPTDDLKSIQKKLANALWNYQVGVWKEAGIKPNLSHAFERNKSIITNAKPHRNKRFVLNIDLESFFDSFHFGRVQGFFEKNQNFNLPHEVATTIAQIACYQGRLPQGAPSSPVITNLICQILDMRLLKVAKKFRVDYTRYADDLTFSTNDKLFLDNEESFLEEITAVIQKAGFQINRKKTRLLFRDSKQEVTGLVVNEKLNVDRRYYKETRSMAHRLYTQGSFEINQKPASKGQLEGRFSFINQLERYNNKIDGNTHDFWHLSGREKQYQAFLFYKYFFDNDMPLIVTEGKTDVLYLKAALKSLYQEYPNLVSKTAEGKFVFHISFFKRSKRLEYFLDISLDGADAMKHLYNYFGPKGSKRNYPDYFNKFRTLGNREPKNPVIMVFDNEMASGKRPLHEFLNYTGLDNSEKERLSKEHNIKLISESNLFLVTNPLVKGKNECEIEDLFTDETLSQVLGGKTFLRPKDADPEK